MLRERFERLEIWRYPEIIDHLRSDIENLFFPVGAAPGINWVKNTSRRCLVPLRFAVARLEWPLLTETGSVNIFRRILCQEPEALSQEFRAARHTILPLAVPDDFHKPGGNR
ncbi:hypothetical protein PILCRDRAFT_711991 [Piloderma croceum F 1598]|uniref:Uncharacterized protein n=1 Tax=Piloderma croceum (strain F 1598) TaxID=765440 RepID=A0A0C3B9W4_PILCF|nr:hypothetical protein PILCRDRAFT_711991 [Piloderma croceum F 1598]